MLPQGEFRKLLTSETENKEEMRRILKTDRYKLMRELLDQKKTMERRLTRKTERAESYISVMFLNYQFVMDHY